MSTDEPAPHIRGPWKEGGQHMRSRFYRTLGGFAAAALVVVAVTANTAVAGGKTPPAPKTCGTSPSTVTIGSGYTLVGSGFTAGMGVTVYVADPGNTTWTYNGFVASNGTYSIPATANFKTSGSKSIAVNKTGDRKMQTLCSSQFTAQ